VRQERMARKGEIWSEVMGIFSYKNNCKKYKFNNQTYLGNLRKAWNFPAINQNISLV